MALSEELKDKWGKTPSQIFGELLREQGVAEYVDIGGTWEGRMLPSGIEDESKDILTKDGTVRIYMLRWDPEKVAPDGTKGYYVLGTTVTYDADGIRRLQADPRYIKGRKKLGLPLTDEQQKILQKWEEEHK